MQSMLDYARTRFEFWAVSRWYRVNYHALVKRKDAGQVALRLARALLRSGPWRRRLCDQCERWKPVMGLDNYPHRPGAKEPHLSCDGCIYALLDELPQEPRPKKKRLLMQLPVVETTCLRDIQHTRRGLKLGSLEKTE